MRRLLEMFLADACLTWADAGAAHDAGLPVADPGIMSDYHERKGGMLAIDAANYVDNLVTLLGVE